MVNKDKYTETNKLKLKASTKTASSLECGCANCDWLWGNGKNYCPYCQAPIRV
ncbi:MAG: hypothetical protein FWH07_00195 [Oscillospiraceae bacterium]|nr:hypothetical protein [Oscillospiraceae bacterium]